MASRLKGFGLFLVLLVAASYAVYRDEQAFAIVALLLMIGVSFKQFSAPLVARITEFARRVDYAKFRDLELRSAEQRAELTRLEGLQLTVLQDVVLRNLEPELCGVLANLTTHERAPIELAHIQRLRELRNRGLITHDKPALSKSSEIWLTPLGKEVGDLLTKLKPDAEN